jgi:hypothetical protein
VGPMHVICADYICITDTHISITRIIFGRKQLGTISQKRVRCGRAPGRYVVGASYS